MRLVGTACNDEQSTFFCKASKISTDTWNMSYDCIHWIFILVICIQDMVIWRTTLMLNDTF